MVSDNRNDGIRKINTAEDLRSNDRVDLHLFKLSRSQWSRFVQDVRWHGKFTDVVKQRAEGNAALIGLMVESYLKEGNQPLPKDRSQLQYGVSVTDACISWETTERMLTEGAKLLRTA